MLRIQNLEKTYQHRGMAQPALRGVDLDIARGEIFGLIGPARSGKTTLIRCINMLEYPTRGSIVLDQIRLTDIPVGKLKSARTQAGMIFQQNFLMPSLTVWDNIALPLVFAKIPKLKHGSIIHPILSTLGITHKKDTYPNALSKLVSLKVALARALVMNPRLLLCDEITHGLDLKSALDILGILQRLHEEFDLTLLLVTHHTEAIKNMCERIAFLEQGRIVEQGTPLDLILNPQSNCAKKFVRNLARTEMPYAIRRNMQPHAFTNSHPILRLAFSGERAQEPLFAEIIQQFDVNINIIQGHQETIQKTRANFMLLELKMQHTNIEALISFFEQQKIYAEVIGYVPNAT